MNKNSEKDYTLNQILELTGITRRNVKFWTNVYNIKPTKVGRRNYYSEIELQLLKMISFLSSHSLYTQKFIKLLVDFNLQRLNLNKFDFKSFYKKFDDLLSNNDMLKKINLHFSLSGYIDNQEINSNNNIENHLPSRILKKKKSIKKEDKLKLSSDNSNVDQPTTQNITKEKKQDFLL